MMRILHRLSTSLHHISKMLLEMIRDLQWQTCWSLSSSWYVIGTPFLAKTWHWSSSLTQEHLSLVFISLRLFANRATSRYVFPPSDYQRRRLISRTSTPLSTCALRCIFRILYIEQINLERLTMNNCVLARTDMPTGAKASAPLMAAATTRRRVLRIILLLSR